MSVESIARVLRYSQAVGTDLAVLLGIANHDGDGGAWPSLATLSGYTNVDERTVRRSIRKLEAAGELRVHLQEGGTDRTRNDRRPNRYEILLDGGTPTSPRSSNGGTPTSERGDAGVTGGGTHAPPEPSFNRPITATTEDGEPLNHNRSFVAEGLRDARDIQRERDQDREQAAPMPEGFRDTD